MGLNTGGMGAYAPAPVVTEDVRSRAIREIVEPMHLHLSSQEVPYRGCLYVGLMTMIQSTFCGRIQCPFRRPGNTGDNTTDFKRFV